MFTGTLSNFSHNVYAIIDPGSILSYVTLLVTGKFKRTLKVLVKPFVVFMLVGESITARKVYQNCIITVYGRDTMDKLVEL